jgi:hypothetical protein
MYSNAISQSAAILTGLAKLDVEQAWVALEERKAEMLAAAFKAALAKAELPPERAGLVSAGFVRRLRTFPEDEQAAGEVLSGVVIPRAPVTGQYGHPPSARYRPSVSVITAATCGNALGRSPELSLRPRIVITADPYRRVV